MSVWKELISVHRTVTTPLVHTSVRVTVVSSLMLMEALVMVRLSRYTYYGRTSSFSFFLAQTSMSAVMAFTAVNKSVVTLKDHTTAFVLTVMNLIVMAIHVMVRMHGS